MITFIGDAHGLYQRLNKRVLKAKDAEMVIQVGDLGLGFHTRDHKRRFAPNFKFIRGNHDNPALCKDNPHYLGDFGHLPEYDLCFISGADSVDKYKRVEGIDWWPDENLSYAVMNQAIDLCVEKKPKILVTHDCPQSLYDTVTDGKFTRYGSTENVTARAFDCLFEECKPKLWIFGHHHKDKMFTHNGTTFVCLPELVKLNVDYNSL